MAIDDYEHPKKVVDSIADGIFHLCANLESRMSAGEEMPNEEITAVIGRLKDYAADLQLAASRMSSE